MQGHVMGLNNAAGIRANLTLKEELEMRKQKLEDQLVDVNRLINNLDSNPVVAETLELINKVRNQY